MLRVLALDISSTRTGWCVDRAEGGPPRTGSWSPRASGAARMGAIGREFEDWLFDFVGLCSAELIAYEAPAVGGGDIIRTVDESLMLIGLAFCVEIVADDLGMRRPVRAAVSTIRKHFVQNGHAKKRDVVKRCELLRWDVRNHDAADAAALWHWAKSKNDKTFNGVGTPLFARNPAQVTA
jgi:hypothetical protein